MLYGRELGLPGLGFHLGQHTQTREPDAMHLQGYMEVQKTSGPSDLKRLIEKTHIDFLVAKLYAQTVISDALHEVGAPLIENVAKPALQHVIKPAIKGVVRYGIKPVINYGVKPVLFGIADRGSKIVNFLDPKSAHVIANAPRNVVETPPIEEKIHWSNDEVVPPHQDELLSSQIMQVFFYNPR